MSSMPPRMTLLGPLERLDHAFVPADAKCYFWGEYTSYEHTGGKRWDYSPTNRLVANLKKKMDKRGTPEWRYKREAIEFASRAFARFWQWKELKERHRLALVPIPPSRARTDPMFDPRMREILEGIAAEAGLALDIRDCLSFSGRYGASHESEARPGPTELFDDLTFDPQEGRPAEQPGAIFLFDDMLTTGAHFVAASRRLATHFPAVPVVGQFVARRRVPDPFGNLEPS